jgi:hypothetical protein
MLGAQRRCHGDAARRCDFGRISRKWPMESGRGNSRASGRGPISCRTRVTSRGRRFWREKSTDRLRMITLRPAGSGHVLSTPRRFEVEAPPDAANAGAVQWFRSQSKYFYLKNCYMISNPYTAMAELGRLKSPPRWAGGTGGLARRSREPRRRVAHEDSSIGSADPTEDGSIVIECVAWGGTGDGERAEKGYALRLASMPQRHLGPTKCWPRAHKPIP